MNRPRQQITGSVLTTFILTMVVLIPVWISDTLEPLEVETRGLKPYSQLVCESSIEWNNTTISSYQPYLEMNGSNVFSMPESRYGHQYNSINSCDGYWGSDGTIPAHLWNNPASWNVDNYRDYFYLPYWSNSGADQGLFLMIPSFQDLVDDNANQLYIYWDTPAELYIGEIKAFGSSDTTQDIGSTHVMTTTTNNIEDRTSYAYEREILIEIASSDLTLAASQCNDDPIHEIFIQFEMNSCSNSESNPWIFDMQISPEYYEITDEIPHNTTVWDNRTVTHYEPYIMTIGNPTTWIEWGLGFSGAVFLATALFMNPLVNPIRFMRKFRFNPPGILKLKRRR